MKICYLIPKRTVPCENYPSKKYNEIQFSNFGVFGAHTQKYIDQINNLAISNSVKNNYTWNTRTVSPKQT